jgi:hypothetical protein
MQQLTSTYPLTKQQDNIPKNKQYYTVTQNHNII